MHTIRYMDVCAFDVWWYIFWCDTMWMDLCCERNRFRETDIHVCKHRKWNYNTIVFSPFTHSWFELCAPILMDEQREIKMKTERTMGFRLFAFYLFSVLLLLLLLLLPSKMYFYSTIVNEFRRINMVDGFPTKSSNQHDNKLFLNFRNGFV